jgi:hypothetical protein
MCYPLGLFKCHKQIAYAAFAAYSDGSTFAAVTQGLVVREVFGFGPAYVDKLRPDC